MNKEMDPWIFTYHTKALAQLPPGFVRKNIFMKGSRLFCMCTTKEQKGTYLKVVYFFYTARQECVQAAVRGRWNMVGRAWVYKRSVSVLVLKFVVVVAVVAVFANLIKVGCGKICKKISLSLQFVFRKVTRTWLDTGKIVGFLAVKNENNVMFINGFWTYPCPIENF